MAPGWTKRWGAELKLQFCNLVVQWKINPEHSEPEYIGRFALVISWLSFHDFQEQLKNFPYWVEVHQVNWLYNNDKICSSLGYIIRNHYSPFLFSWYSQRRRRFLPQPQGWTSWAMMLSWKKICCCPKKTTTNKKKKPFLCLPRSHPKGQSLLWARSSNQRLLLTRWRLT